MAYHATGRSRTVTLTLNAVQDLETGLNYLVSGLPATEFLASGTSGAFGCFFSVGASLLGTTWESAPGAPAPPPWEGRRVVQLQLDVGVTLRGSTTTTYTTYHTGYGSYTTTGTDPTTNDGIADFIHTDVLTEGEDGVTGTLTVEMVLKEYLSDGLGTDPFSTLVEIPYSIAASYTVTGQYKLSTPDGGDVMVSLSDSGTIPLYVLVGPSHLTVDEYAGAVSLQAVLGISNSLGISASGLGYSGTASATDGGSSASGSLSGFTFTRSDNTKIGSASLTVSPDWACSFDVGDYDWENLAELTGVERELYSGSTLIETATDADFRYPAGSGWKGRITINCRDWVSGGAGTTGENYERLFNTSGSAVTTDGFWLRPSSAWGDSVGRYLASANFTGNPAWYQTRVLDSFSAGTIQLASSFRHTIWDTAANLFGSSCTLTQDGSYVKVTNANAFFSNVQQLTPSSTSAEGSAPFRPIPYRYFRARIKSSVAGRRIRFQHGSYTWDFTPTTTDWETHEFDLCQGDSYFNSARYPSSPSTMRFEHPADLQGSTTGELRASGNWNVRFPDAVSTDEYWLDYIEGYVKTEGRTDPVLLIGPCECLDRSPFSFTTQDNSYEACSHPLAPVPSVSDYSGGTLFGRLIVNGVVGANLRGTGSLTSWFSTLQSTLGGRGLTFSALGSTAQLAYTHADNGWIEKAQGGAEAAFPLDEAVDIYAAPTRYVCGYYGMGNPRTGAYGALLEYHIRKQWNGELLGNAWNDTDGSVRGAPVALVDDDGSVVDSTSSDIDGLYRLHAKYGVVRPYSNVGASCAARQQYTGTTPDNYVYTATGELFNAYWLRGSTLLDKDASDYASFFYTRDRYAIFDRHPYLRDVKATGISFAAQDLIQMLGVPWWLRVRAADAEAVIERSLDAGVTWAETETIGAPVVLETGTYPSAPTLSRTRWDEVFCAFHDEDGDALLYLSTDMGETFNLHATHPLLRYPRVVVQDHLTWLAAHDGTQLCFYTSDDFLATKTEVTALRITCPVQLAAFGQDRRGILHVLYRDSGDTLYHRYSADGAAWSSAASVALAAAYPSWAHNSPVAMVTWFDSGTLHVGVFESDYRTFSMELSAPSGSWTPGHMGLAASHREEFMLLGDISGSAEVRYSPDEGANWSTPS